MLFAGVPTRDYLFRLFQSRESPPQLHNVLPHRIFDDLAFFNAQNQLLRRGAVQ